MHRVVVTGLGAITPIGLGVERFWRNLRGGASGIGPITSFDTTGLSVQVAAEVPDFDPRNFMDFKAARRMDRVSQFAVAAAGEAIADAALQDTAALGGRIGAMINTGAGGIQSLVREAFNYHTKGPARVSPFAIPMFTPNMPACQVSITYGIRGPVMASVAACAAGTQALVDARRLLQLGEVDVMVVGGTEAVMGLAVIAFGNMGALSRRGDATASRPFDRDRDGCVLGEGCGILVLETEEHARRRGARIYCEVTGGAMTADACHVSAPARDGEGAARAMAQALSQAGTAPREVDYICAHGTATPLNERQRRRRSSPSSVPPPTTSPSAHPRV
jgi:3-oxoacyl-[acyl-carrier-protein] synthase II